MLELHIKQVRLVEKSSARSLPAFDAIVQIAKPKSTSAVKFEYRDVDQRLDNIPASILARIERFRPHTGSSFLPTSKKVSGWVRIPTGHVHNHKVERVLSRLWGSRTWLQPVRN